MVLQKTVFLVSVMMFTSMCALPAAIATGGVLVLPPVFAQGQVTCQGETATIVGTSDNDNNLVGTSGRDVIAGLEGNDRIEGRGGNDLICGDEGNDDMSGGTGNDRISGGTGADTMNGGDGDDEMSGGTNNDNLNSVDSVVNNDDLDGGTGTDTCVSDPDPEDDCERN
jgi:RTX calcium-binding nonapeptide repeat (4 copies)